MVSLEIQRSATNALEMTTLRTWYGTKKGSKLLGGTEKPIPPDHDMLFIIINVPFIKRMKSSIPWPMMVLSFFSMTRGSTLRPEGGEVSVV